MAKRSQKKGHDRATRKRRNRNAAMAPAPSQSASEPRVVALDKEAVPSESLIAHPQTLYDKVRHTFPTVETERED